MIAGAKGGAPTLGPQEAMGCGEPGGGLGGRPHSRPAPLVCFVRAGASLGLPIIGKLLGYSQPATTARYAHLDADPMRRAANTIGATISAAMGGHTEGNVVTIGKPRRF